MNTRIQIPPDKLGTVNEYTQREAARFAGYTFLDFEALPVGERNRIIAHYRAHSLIEIHQGEAVSEHAKQEADRARRRAGTNRRR